MNRSHIVAAIRALGLVTAVCVLAGASQAHATVVSTSQAGGGGGTAFTQTCAPTARS